MDVRRPNEWIDGIYPGAICVELMHLEKEMEKVPKDKVVHAYCAAGARARMAAFILKRGGVRDVVVTTTGIRQACEANGKELVKP